LINEYLGVSLSLENWNKLKEYVNEIDECVEKMN
jgi:hypothetical protein